MSVRLLIAAALVGYHVHSWQIFIAGGLVSFVFGAFRLEMRGRLASMQEQLRYEIRRMKP